MPRVMVIPVFIPHQGCPHRCIFCNQNLITSGTGYSPVRGLDAAGINPADIDRAISAYLPFQGGRERVELAFFGGNFLGLPREKILELLEAAASWLDKGQIHAIRCSTRPDTVTPDLLKAVQPLGLELVELGVQSMDDRVLALSCRGHVRADTLRAVDHLKAAGMKVGVQLMTGLPGDTPQICEETARQAADLAPDLARIYPVLVLSGSPLAGLYRRGDFVPQSLGEAVSRVGTMVRILEGKGIPVVRMGLQSGEGLEEEGAVLAGPWHPAFGHLVRSALVLEQVIGQLEDLPADPSCQVVLSIHPRWESRLRGDKNGNLKILRLRFPDLDFRISTDARLASDFVRVTCLP